MIITKEHKGEYEIRTSDGEDTILGIVSFNTETNETTLEVKLESYSKKNGSGSAKIVVSAIIPGIKAFHVKTDLPVLTRDEKINKVL